MTAGEILELLGVSPESPGPGFLRRLFDAFVARVPFESASKIVRAAAIGAPGEGPVTAEEFWSEHRERGAGGICFARTFAFGELCRELGFSARYLLGAIGAPRSHAATLVDFAAGTVVADVGFPLPAIYPLSDAVLETPQGIVRVSAGGWQVDFPGTPMADTSIRFEPGGARDEELRQAWIASFEAPTYFSREVVLSRPIDSRVRRFGRGEISILDAHSKLRLPIAADRPATLSRIFEIDEDLVAEALARTGDPEPEISEPEILSYLDAANAEALLAIAATPEGYRRWVSGIGDASVMAASERSFTVEIRSAGTSVEDRVTVADDGSLTVIRNRGLARTGLSVLKSSTGPRLVRRAVLPGSYDDFLRSDLARGRVAGLLAMDLLSLARLSENETFVVAEDPKPRIP